jgi:hypothetical protein
MTLIEDQTYIGTPKVDGVDNHAYAFGPGQDHTMRRCVFTANGASEALKFSNAHRVSVEDCAITGGVEDGLDIVRGTDYQLVGCIFSRRQAKQDATIKGGVDGVSFRFCLGLKKVVLGDYSIYDRAGMLPTTRNISFVNSGHPWVVCFNAERPSGIPWYRVLKVPSFAVWLYFWARVKCFKETGVNAAKV